jgi:two-component system response regulator AtoC
MGIPTSTRLAGSADTPFLLKSTNSPAMQALERMVAKLAPTNIPLLLVGESGTGKEMFAQEIHKGSLNANQPFVKVICASLNGESFPSCFKGSDGVGTLFLEEVSELDAASQRNLLYSLPQEDGGSAGDLSRPRLISSTTTNLEERVRAGLFRADLYYQISAVSVPLPPLRQRREDIPAFVELFLLRYASLFGGPRPHLESLDYTLLQECSWPGNIRELENVVRKIVATNDPEAVLSELRIQVNEAATSPLSGKVSPLKKAARAASHRTERQLILETLARTRWNRKRAAQELQISYKSLLYKLKQICAEEQETA